MELNKENFDEFIKSKPIVLVDFWAAWCGPCKLMLPRVDELIKEYGDHEQAAVGKIEVEENAGISGIFNIKSLPTLIIFKNGVEYKRLTGLKPKDSVRAEIDESIASLAELEQEEEF